MSNLKNIVIVGAASSGAGLARALESTLPQTHRIVLIDANEYAFYPPGSLRASVAAGWEKKIMLPLSKFFPESSRHLVIPGNKVVRLEEDAVVLEKPVPSLGGKDRITFDRAVLATGSQYPFPARPGSSQLSTAVAGFSQLQSSIASASSFLIIGGGAVGVEMAGELRCFHPNKDAISITLVHSGQRLIGGGTKSGVHDKLMSQLKDLNVNVILGDKVHLDTTAATGPVPGGTVFKTAGGHDIEPDFLFLATGVTPASSLVSSADPNGVSELGRVKVSPTFQLTSPTLSKYFAIGDVTDFTETKTLGNIFKHIPIVASNVVAAINGSDNLKQYTPSAAPMIVVTLGDRGGAGQIMITIGSFLTRLLKGKTLFVQNFEKLYNAKGA